MVNKREFQQMSSEMTSFDEKREEIIKKSRDILKLSKQAVYDVHREDLNYAKKRIDSAKKEIDKLKKEISKTKTLGSIGAYNAALEEWTEASCYYGFVKKGEVPTKKSLKVGTEVYLGGLSDLTGELGRRAVNSAIKGRKDEVSKIRDVIDDIYGEFLKFNFRNSDLRKKSDQIKWNLKKVEEVLYDLQKRR